MKLNNKRTITIGLAFFSICAFWQMYDTVIPLILRDTFHLEDGISGFIMALDNILAVFMLPFFGRLSDKTNTKIGKRMPYIIGGTVFAMVFTSFIGLFSLRGSLTGFIISLGLLLFSMGVYRSPAVALIPDVTPKPLRSKANAIINLMGALGGVYAIAVIKFLTQTAEDGTNSFKLVLLAVALLMGVSVALLFFMVNENKMAVENTQEDTAKNTAEKLSKPQLKSLIFILLSVALWYMGYNAVTTAYSKYYTTVWGGLSGATTCLLIATGGAVVSYIPVGILSSKIGRKKMILIGVFMLAACFGSLAFIKTYTVYLNAIFVVVGFSWAAINVNSYPMVVDISKSGDVGKYTGYYYTFSMAAQIITPVISGYMMEKIGYHTLFPYAAITVALAFLTMCFVKHGDSKANKAESVLMNFDTEE